MKNILHIMPDQLRYDVLGCRGVFPVRTPNMDALVANGTIFERAYCANPLCVPSRTSLMTGRACHEHGVYYNSQPVPRGMDTLQGILSANGYYTVSVGKMHFNPQTPIRAKRTSCGGITFPVPSLCRWSTTCLSIARDAP